MSGNDEEALDVAYAEIRTLEADLAEARRDRDALSADLDRAAREIVEAKEIARAAMDQYDRIGRPAVEKAERERNSALEQRRIALDAAKKAKRDAEDLNIGLRDLLARALIAIDEGGIWHGGIGDEITAALDTDPDAPRETVADLRRRVEAAEQAAASARRWVEDEQERFQAYASERARQVFEIAIDDVKSCAAIVKDNLGDEACVALFEEAFVRLVALGEQDASVDVPRETVTDLRRQLDAQAREIARRDARILEFESSVRCIVDNAEICAALDTWYRTRKASVQSGPGVTLEQAIEGDENELDRAYGAACEVLAALVEKIS